MITIEVNNATCQLYGDRKAMHLAYKAFKIRNPNAFFLRKYMPRGWDGKQDYIKDNGKFPTGLLPKVYAYFKSMGITPTLKDERDLPPLGFKVPKNLNGLIPRPYQTRGVKALIENTIGGIPFPTGVLKFATNAGKTLIACMLYKALGSKKTLYIINSSELYTQALKEVPEILGAEKFGCIEPDKIVWANFMICKVHTMSNRCSSHDFKAKLAEYEVCIIDECDLADNKTYKTILKNLWNAWAKIGMSGSIYVSPLAKDKLKNENLRSFMSDIVAEVTNRELIDLGYSSEVKAIFNKGNEDYRGETFPDEYLYAIIKNKARNRKVYKRVKYRLKKGHYPLVVIIKEHKHLKILQKLLTRKLPEYRIEGVHHKTENRFEIVDNFKKGDYDILVASMILKRGKNFPLMQTLINAAGGDSPENFIQILGRAMRKNIPSSKAPNVKYYEDFFDEGKYIKRHSKHRLVYAKKQQLQIIENYKK